MIDIYAAIAVGIALIIGVIPLIRQIITKYKNFLVQYYVDKQKFEEYLMQLKKDGDWIEWHNYLKMRIM